MKNNFKLINCQFINNTMKTLFSDYKSALIIALDSTNNVLVINFKFINNTALNRPSLFYIKNSVKV